MKAVLRIYATGLWTGFFPVASGTAGSLLALALWLCVPILPLGQEGVLTPGTIAFLVVVLLVGVPACKNSEAEFGEDGGPIVIDEVLGVWITIAGLAPTPFVAIAGFLLFRAFDIFKPWPAGMAEKWGGGWGVMMDDVFAGIYAAIALRLLLQVPMLGSL
ncbi:MAG: phosphatidylglycerophosphatase A [Gemmatimonadota bacterium]|nr:MAG: phosphatidylglycerophosphatase A [Gemmatimonadota bacterium]